MSDERGRKRNRAYINREFLDGCFYDDSYMVALCIQRLVDAEEVSFTSHLPPKEEDVKGFFYMHFGDNVPKNIEKEYNRLLLHKQYLDKKGAEIRIQTATFEDVITDCPDSYILHINEIEF